MLRCLKPIYNIPLNFTRPISQKYATYLVENANAMKSSHEQTKENPLLPKKIGRAHV